MGKELTWGIARMARSYKRWFGGFLQVPRFS
jgi:hypothetical protein